MPPPGQQISAADTRDELLVRGPLPRRNGPIDLADGRPGHAEPHRLFITALAVRLRVSGLAKALLDLAKELVMRRHWRELLEPRELHLPTAGAGVTDRYISPKGIRHVAPSPQPLGRGRLMFRSPRERSSTGVRSPRRAQIIAKLLVRRPHPALDHPGQPRLDLRIHPYRPPLPSCVKPRELFLKFLPGPPELTLDRWREHGRFIGQAVT